MVQDVVGRKLRAVDSQGIFGGFQRADRTGAIALVAIGAIVGVLVVEAEAFAMVGTIDGEIVVTATGRNRRRSSGRRPMPAIMMSSSTRSTDADMASSSPDVPS